MDDLEKSAKGKIKILFIELRPRQQAAVIT